MDNDKKRRTLSIGQIIAYGGGGMFTYGYQLMLTGYYLMFFMTDVLLFPTLAAATIMTFVQWIKVAMMIVAGLIIDSTNLPWGKYRSWIMIAAIGLLIFFPLTFSDFGLSTTAAIAVFCICMTLMFTFYNLGWTSMRAMVGKMSKNNQDILALSVAAQVGGTASGVSYAVVGPAVLGIGLWAGTTNAYAGAAFIYGSLIVIGGIAMMKITKQYQSKPSDDQSNSAKSVKSERIGFFKMIKSLRGPMIPYAISMTFASAQAGIFAILLVYYAGNVLGDPAVAAIALSAVSFAALIGAFFVPPVANKFNKKSTHMAAQGISAVLYIIIALFGTNAVLFVALRALISFVGTFTAIFIPAMAVDISDHFEMKGENPPRAFIQSIGGTTMRVGMLIGTTVASFGLAAIGYSAGVEFTSDMISKLIAMISIGPAIVCVLSVVSIAWYKINESELDGYRNQKFSEKSAVNS